MIELLGDLTNPVALVIDGIIIVVVGNWLWKNAIQPTWRAVRGFVKQKERQEVLNEIADHFRPNGKSSLPEQVTQILKRLDSLEDGQEAIGNKIDIFIADRQPGGRRHTDPQGSEK